MSPNGGNEQITVAPGRALLFAAWPDEDAFVVFDGNSGDYWIVPELSHRLLMRLSGAASTELGALADAVRMEYRPARDVNEIEVIVEDLIAARLVATVRG